MASEPRIGITRLSRPGLGAGIDLERDLEDVRVKGLLDNAAALNTRVGYRRDWDLFVGWCLERSLSAFPASPDTIISYVLWLVDRPFEVVREEVHFLNGRISVRKRTQRPVKVATVGRHLAAISFLHRTEKATDPTKDQSVKDVVRGIRVERGVAPRPKKDFNREVLIEAFAHLSFTRLIEKRDRALILLGWSGAFRRSEIASIDVEHISRELKGLDILLPHSKTNQEGEHEFVLIGYAEDQAFCAIRALDEWLRAAAILEGPIFRQVSRHGRVGGRISPKVVASVTKRFARAAGLNEKDFAGHSLRSGWITTAAAANRHERDIMRHSRHKSLPVFRRYVRLATKWSEHPGAGLI